MSLRISIKWTANSLGKWICFIDGQFYTFPNRRSCGIPRKGRCPGDGYFWLQLFYDGDCFLLYLRIPIQEAPGRPGKPGVLSLYPTNLCVQYHLYPNCIHSLFHLYTPGHSSLHGTVLRICLSQRICHAAVEKKTTKNQVYYSSSISSRRLAIRAVQPVWWLAPRP